MDSTWFIEGFLDETKRLRRVPIARMPFRVGRGSRMDLQVLVTSVSKHHADLSPTPEGLRVIDRKSTNGTFVNGERLQGSTLVQEGTILHFADLEWRVGRMTPEQTAVLLGSTDSVGTPLPSLVIDRARLLQSEINSETILSVYQPIVDLDSGEFHGYEALARAELRGEETGAIEIFQLAVFLGAEDILSRLSREVALQSAAGLEPALLFTNTHPAEIEKPATLLAALERLRAQHPALDLVVELHEAALSNASVARELRDELRALDIGLAYDDFGTGQSRLAELDVAPPDYIKIDRSLIAGFPDAGMSRKIVAEVCRLADENEITIIAEGVETEEQVEHCRDLGITLAQGYHFARPAPAAHWKK